ncbi:tyrosine-type recombinase/integrase [Bifidobacterium simiiventris]|uniref:tyrosine-type recombinase/integrase n=1 Tax=Bifidobacterium simiiventris TaxID=2834434 RepID=UPI001C5A328E|nr:tyrosine-type recombinase/integrase [Bifidobacterium simiiventris]MBW3077734.1 site-specific integrase [Bifidobacterium simiiventris]
MPKRFGAIRLKPNKTTPKYIEASYLTPIWAFGKWPGLKERQYANFDPDDEDGARAWLRQARISIEAGTWQPEKTIRREQITRSLTFADYFEQWIENRRTPAGQPLEAGTRYRLRKDAENHVLPTFGRMRLTEITSRDIDRWWDGLDHTQPSMCINALKTLNAILNTASKPGRDGEPPLIPANPCNITTPKHRRKTETIPATVEQLRVIHDNMPARYAASIYISVFCNGLRIGEVCALRRRSIRLDTRTLAIRESRKTMSGNVLTGKPKTDNSNRDETIPPQLIPTIRTLLEQTGPDPDSFLFPSVNDPAKPLHPNTLRAWYDTARRKAGRPDLRFHDLRHTALTLLAQEGATVRELMDAAGHSTPQMAMRYQHAVTQRSQELADRLGRLIPDGDDPDALRARIEDNRRQISKLETENRELRRRLADLRGRTGPGPHDDGSNRPHGRVSPA